MRPLTLVAAVGAIAATYLYFLLFAEFALLSLLTGSGASSAALRPILLSLGLGGLAGSLLAGRVFRMERFQSLLSGCFIAAGLGGIVLLRTHTGALVFIAVGTIGLTLGALTVSLAAGLRATVGERRLGRVIGIGTGLAYAACNVPLVFEARPQVQTGLAALAVLSAAMLPPFLRPLEEVASPPPSSRPDFWRWLGVFLVLVWLDSAVFYIIQHADTLRSATWSGGPRLWLNAGVHIAAAAAAGWALDRGGLRLVTAIGLAALLIACLMLANSCSRPFATLLYPFGVSCYSVALVYYPAARGRAWDAALVFAIAGWLGSALGIGMAQDLSRVPSWFALPAAVFGLLLLLGPTLRRPAGSVVVILALLVIQPQETCAQGADVLRGRDVYIAEGCIHCHSQYLRPETPDTARWGAALPLDAALAGTPPLLGNRRQGPDLSRVGQRRTPEWNRLHLIAPRSIVPGSRMPSYAHLFRGAGDDGRALLAYLSALGTAEDSQRSPGAAAAPRSRATGLAAGTETVHTAP